MEDVPAMFDQRVLVKPEDIHLDQMERYPRAKMNKWSRQILNNYVHDISRYPYFILNLNLISNTTDKPIKIILISKKSSRIKTL